MSPFECLVLDRLPGTRPTLAAAAARAGGVGVVDLETRGVGDGLAAVRALSALARPGDMLGIRGRLDQLVAAAAMLPPGVALDVALVAHGPDASAAAPREVGALARRTAVEVLDARPAERLPEGADALVAVGGEAGGWCAEESTPVLVQRLLARTTLPVLARGAVGVAAAAALRVLGASGVVLADEVLLMEESAPGTALAALLERGDADATEPLGGAFDAPCRVVVRPGAGAGRALAADAEALEARGADVARWRRAADDRLGLGDDDAWPVGQGLVLAASLRRAHGRVGRLVRAVRDLEAVRIGHADAPATLRPGAPLAAALGTELAVVQGPMTRVSDVPAFAGAVASAGALPMVALATMDGERAEATLRATADAVGSAPFGAGILGFVPPDVRSAQMDALRRVRPRAALIAGGRPAQAAALEAEGIVTFLHVPTPALLERFLDEGARRFVLEGRECGGHVGPLASLPLWERQLELLERALSGGATDEVDVLLAGGVHDAASAAAAAVMAAPAAAAGARVGVLVGTAYLLTREAVTTGAVTEAFQEATLGATRTVTLESGPGHAIRAADTPFVAEFRAIRQEALAAGDEAHARRERLEVLGLGRLRLAAKGEARSDDGSLFAAAPDRQHREGLFMMGQVAGLRDAACTVGELHDALTRGAATLLTERARGLRPRSRRRPPPAPIAIVGISTLLPGAHDVEGFWDGLVNGSDRITPVPERRFDPATYPADGDQALANAVGGFLTPMPFDPLRYGIAPAALGQIDAGQLLALEAARRALADSGAPLDDAERERTAVILGMSVSSGDLNHAYTVRAQLPSLLGEVPQAADERLPEWTEDSFPGVLANVAAGRIANRLDLGGANYVVDAACASSLAAVDLAVRELRDGRSDLVVTGGVDAEVNPVAYVCFSAAHALSPSGRARVFDRAADGIVISEGAVALVLRRLEDADRDGDRVYAVIRAMAGSSDGKAMGLTAPRTAGQRRALDRAYAAAGVSPAQIGLYEAHATGTAVGDRTEVRTVRDTLRAAGAGARSCAIGSLKSQIGHTKAAAGAAGLAKVALALHHRTIPPHTGAEDPIEELTDPDGPLYLPAEARAWTSSDAAPRRAAVSAFGFGGTNFHAVVEEHSRPLVPAAPGAARWPAELVTLAADDRAGLARAAGALASRAGQAPGLALRALADSAGDGRGDVRAAVVAADTIEAAERLRALERALLAGDETAGPGVWLPRPPAGRVGLLFSGQGSAVPGMGRELALYLPEIRDALERADAAVGDVRGARLSELVDPAPGVDRREAHRALAETDVAQPALCAMELGMLGLLRRVGLAWDHAAGHSLGELVALHAADAFDADALIALAVARGRAMRAADAGRGAMAAVRASAAELAPHLGEDVVVACHNGPRQTVVAGVRDEVLALVDRLAAAGVVARPLEVGGAFHSPLMHGAKEGLAEAVARMTTAAPTRPVHAYRDGRVVERDGVAVARTLVEGLAAPVHFDRVVEGMWDAGVRTWVEVGPGGVLGGLVREALGDRAGTVLATGTGGLRGLLGALAELWVEGALARPAALRDDRHAVAEPEPDGEWLLDGGGVMHRGEAGYVGRRRPPLRADQAAARSAAAPGGSGPPPVASAAPGVAPAVPAPPAVATGAVPHPSAVEDAFAAHQRTMRRFLEVQESVMAAFLGGAPATPAPVGPARDAEPPVETPAPPSPAPTPAAAIEPSARATTTTDPMARIVELLSERTGFPASMLGPDVDLEAELGIDSIKRVEVLGAMQGADAPPPDDDEMALLLQARTLREVVACLTEVAPAEGGDAGVAEQERRAALAATTATLVPETAPVAPPRMVMAATPTPLDRPAADGTAIGSILVAGADGPAGAVADALRARGFDARAGADGPGARALVWLGGLEVASGPAGAGAAAASGALDLLGLLRDLSPSLRDGGRILALSEMGGAYGRDGSLGPAGPSAGAGLGMVNVLAREWAPALARAVDLPGGWDPIRIAEVVADELARDGDEHEVGYPDGVRTRFTPRAAEQDVGDPPAPARVLVATGGARGITAECASALAGPDTVVVALGRGPHPDDVVDPAPDAEDEAALVRHLAARSGSPDSPAALRADARTILAAREVRSNLGRLGDPSRSEYVSVDVRDGDALAGVLADVVARHGAIDAVLHGAGVIEDAPVERKQAESFARVFDTKVDGLANLLAVLDPGALETLVLLTSVSGRFGTPGQIDYAAANEVLNRMAWQFAHRHPHTRVRSLNWGPWSGAGMADDGVRARLAERGIGAIAPEEGRRALRERLAGDDVELIVGAGPWSAP